MYKAARNGKTEVKKKKNMEIYKCRVVELKDSVTFHYWGKKWCDGGRQRKTLKAKTELRHLKKLLREFLCKHMHVLCWLHACLWFEWKSNRRSFGSLLETRRGGSYTVGVSHCTIWRLPYSSQLCVCQLQYSSHVYIHKQEKKMSYM